ERAASKIPDVPADTPARKIAKVAVIGAGLMGIGIGMSFLNAGLPVTLLETNADVLARGVETIRRRYEDTAKRASLSRDQIADACRCSPRRCPTTTSKAPTL
ncbi:hypothetical protein BZM27_55205, partial [Paraburkholderia steynii]